MTRYTYSNLTFVSHCKLYCVLISLYHCEEMQEMTVLFFNLPGFHRLQEKENMYNRVFRDN